MVDTSVAVATPSTTAARIKNGSAMPGSAMSAATAICDGVARLTFDKSSLRERHHTTTQRASASTSAGNRPPVNRAAMETFATEPMVMSTRDGGIVSLLAADEASIA